MRLLCLVLSILWLRVGSSMGAGVSIELLSFNSNGLLASGKHCDPMWFTGRDQCDISLKICVELNSALTPGITQCMRPWIFLGQVSNNQDLVNFQADTIYGGWANPTVLQLPSTGNPWTGFTVKLVAMDVDLNGQAQLIDSWTHKFTTANDSLCPSARVPANIRSYGHPRPLASTCFGSPNCPSNLTLAWAGTQCRSCPPCLNGGTPSVDAVTNKCVCLCPPHFAGPFCGSVVCDNGGSSGGPNNSCLCPRFYGGRFCEKLVASSCYDWFKYKKLHLARFPQLQAANGIYNLTLNGTMVKQAYCDMTAGGATVILRRQSIDAAAVNFSQSWATYKSGFGNLNYSHYLGNDAIYLLSNIPGVPMSLRVVVRECNDTSAYAPSFTYSSFRLLNTVNYTLQVSTTNNTNGGARDSLNLLSQGTRPNNGQVFSTIDRPDSGNLPPFLGSCAKVNGGGFWYGVGCGSATLNSHYYANCKASSGFGIRWLSLSSSTTSSMAFAKMELIPQNKY